MFGKLGFEASTRGMEGLGLNFIYCFWIRFGNFGFEASNRGGDVLGLNFKGSA